MSITFHPAVSLADVQCASCEGVGCDEFGTACVECAGQGFHVPMVNVANGNARDLLAALGLEAADWGEVDARDLRARALLRSGLPADEPVPAVRVGNMVWCGRREGQLRDYCARLVPVCEEAERLGVEVMWG